MIWLRFAIENYYIVPPHSWRVLCAHISTDYRNLHQKKMSHFHNQLSVHISTLHKKCQEYNYCHVIFPVLLPLMLFFTYLSCFVIWNILKYLFKLSAVSQQLYPDRHSKMSWYSTVIKHCHNKCHRNIEQQHVLYYNYFIWTWISVEFLWVISQSESTIWRIIYYYLCACLDNVLIVLYFWLIRNLSSRFSLTPNFLIFFCIFREKLYVNDHNINKSTDGSDVQ